MRRALLVLAVALGGLGIFAGGLAWVLNDPRPPAKAPRGERLYYTFCASCHGVDGRGSWRAALFLIRPGDLTKAAEQSDRYLFDIIKQGGASLGRPGMPAFGAQLSDADIQALVAYVKAARPPLRSSARTSAEAIRGERGNQRSARASPGRSEGWGYGGPFRGPPCPQSSRSIQTSTSASPS